MKLLINYMKQIFIFTKCIYEKTVVCNNRTINSAIGKLNAGLEAFSENCNETGCYQLGISELVDVLKKAMR